MMWDMKGFDPLTHALGIFSTGQQIAPVNADQLGQNDDHKETAETDEENGPIRRGLIRTRMVLVEVGGVLHDSDSVNQGLKNRL